MRTLQRRTFLAQAALVVPLSRVITAADGQAAGPTNPPAPSPAVSDTFPSHPPEMVKEMVTVSHFNAKRVRELVEARPALARAAWDWGFGDWEDALGAASHVGNREIAEYLISRGARPTLFSATMLGQLDAVKAIITALPGAQRIPGPHSISLLSHARAGGPAADEVRRYLESLGDADGPPRAPISAEEMNALSGRYVFGSGETQRIDITVDSKMGLLFTRAGTIGRGLIHLGDHVFHPMGASAARVSFSADRSTLTVQDSDLIVTARRTG